MKSEEMLRDALISEISRRNHCNVDYNETFKTIWITDDSWKVEFRYAISAGRVIISRVKFVQRRKGCMTACVDILKFFAKDLGYDIIIIQSVQTFEMSKWCEKNGFKPDKYCTMEITDDKGRNVIIGDWKLNL